MIDSEEIQIVTAGRYYLLESVEANFDGLVEFCKRHVWRRYKPPPKL